MAQSHIRDARPAHWKSIKKWKIRSVRRCAPNFCQDLGEASELTTNAQRAASALRVYRAHTERIQSVYRTHMLKNPTNAQRVVSAWNKWSAHAPRMHRAFNAQPATGSNTVITWLYVQLVLHAVTCSVATSALQDATLKEKEPEVSEPQEEVSSCWWQRSWRHRSWSQSQSQSQRQRQRHRPRISVDLFSFSFSWWHGLGEVPVLWGSADAGKPRYCIAVAACRDPPSFEGVLIVDTISS